MTTPVQFPGMDGIDAIRRAAASPVNDNASAEPSRFSDMLIESLGEVKRLQDEASEGVERLLTGDSSNPDEVFSAIQKAGVAFSLLMEIRNKLVDAYDELKEMRV